MEKENNIIFTCSDLNLDQALDCGQAFRWRKDENNVWHGVIFGKKYSLIQNDKTITAINCSPGAEAVLKHYFDLDTDYSKIKSILKQDNTLNTAINFCSGIRILKQEPFETLCSFIISQNNNIPRIKGIINRFCESFGEKIDDSSYGFPNAKTIANLDVNDLDPIRSGFRAKYLIDAARKVYSQEIDFSLIEKTDLLEAKDMLMKIKGVGPKVAACVLLYGFNKIESFPIDVWVKRILEELYPNGLPLCTQGYEGIAQQYLFHWYRNK